MSDNDLRLARLRVVQELTFQAAPADEQLQFLALNDWPPMELLKAYLNDSYVMLPHLASEGLLSPRILQYASALGEALIALDAQLAEEYERTGQIGALTTNGIGQDRRGSPFDNSLAKHSTPLPRSACRCRH